MYKLRVKYRKTGDLRFLSHLDLARAFERGIRRGGLPLSFSQGFSPHPKISFGPPLPVGVSSESEYVDLVLSEHLPLDKIASSLHHAFAEDLSCLEVRYVPLDSPSLMSRITLAGYHVVLTIGPELSSEEIQHCIDLSLSMPQIELPVKEGEKLFPTNTIIWSLELEKAEGKIAAFRYVGLLNNAGGVRPEIFIKKMLSLSKAKPCLEFRQIHRTGLYWEEKGELIKP